MKSKINEAEKLKKKIKEREKTLRKFIDFTKELLEKVGVTIFYKMYAYNTRVIKELQDFPNFSFNQDFGHSQFGGNDLSISYKGKPVMVLYSESESFGIDECKVKVFNNDMKWQKALNVIIRNKKKHFSVLTEKRKAEKRMKKKEISNSESIESLKSEAKRLALS